jgi:hypothetical protein
MVIIRACKICGKIFSAQMITNIFCCRKCFKKDYYRRMKVLEKHQNNNPKFPSKRCASCGSITQLEFDPKKHPHLFDIWRCPDCNISNKDTWKLG